MTNRNGSERRNAGPARKREGGSSVVEVTLMSPWIFLLFMGILDFGIYAYGMIATENAVRVALLRTSGTGDPTDPGACAMAINEMQFLPNVQGLTSCVALPLIVTPTEVVQSDSADGLERAAQVSVTYQSVQLIPIPGVTGRLTITRIAQMRLSPGSGGGP